MLKCAIPLLRVRSASAVDRFYCGKLGFRVLSTYRPRSDAADPAYCVLARDGALVHVSSFPGDGAIGHVVTISVDDIEGLFDELIAAGIDTGDGIMDQSWGDREIYVRDPDGNGIRFQAS